MSSRNAHRLLLAPLLVGLGGGACITQYPQLVPGPLPLADATEAAPAPPVPSAAMPVVTPAVTVQRDSDPVWLRRPGERGDYALAYYRKRERVPAGTLVRTGAGGRAEILWAPDASSVALFDEGRVTVGAPERDEPMLRFHSVSHAVLVLTPEDRVELVGGAILAGDPLDLTGTILLESCPGSILRVTNQAKRLATISFREERLELGPGESIDLPVLETGTAPREAVPESHSFELLGGSAVYHGEAERLDDEKGVTLRAVQPTRVVALGIETHLAASETARFSGLSQVRPVTTADPD